MKEYLFCLVPLALCSAVSLVMYFVEPTCERDYPYVTGPYLEWYIWGWLAAGAAISVALAGVFAVNDLFDAYERRSRRKELSRLSGRPDPGK